MSDRWTQLLQDEQVIINKNDEDLMRFVNQTLPGLLTTILADPVTPCNLIRAQFFAIVGMSKKKDIDRAVYAKIGINFAIYSQTTTRDMDEDFYRRVPGFNQEEIAEIHKGSITIEDVMNTRPAVILRPLLLSPRH